MIKLNSIFFIERGSFSWELKLEEEKQRLNKETKEVEQYIVKDVWYYPKISMCLEKYGEEMFSRLKSKEDWDFLKNSIQQIENRIIENIWKPNQSGEILSIKSK